MKFFIISILSLATMAIAGEPEKLYLINCYENGFAGEFYTSKMAWYPKGVNSQNGRLPDSEGTVNDNTWIKWEGNTQAGFFPKDKATAKSHINNGADKLSVGQ